MRRRILILSLLALPGAPAAMAASRPSPEAYIRDFYRRELLPVKRAELRAVFVGDLAAAMLKEYGKDEPGELNFDYRYGAQDWEVKNLRFETSPRLDGALVTSRFESFGKAFTIRFRLRAAGPDGWRIADVYAPAQNGDTSWSLRGKLGLAPAL
jgi:hypothetical protein